MKQLVSILIILSSLTSCQDQVGNEMSADVKKSAKEAVPYSELVLYDDFDGELFLDTLVNRSMTQFSPIYIGELHDSIKLNYINSTLQNVTREWGKYRSPGLKDLLIYIDTTRTIAFPMRRWAPDTEPVYRSSLTSFPIFIENKSFDTLTLGIEDRLPLIIERKDSLGQWVGIERPSFTRCMTLATAFFLPPNQVVITALRQNSEMATTQFRVKYALIDTVMYSNEIGRK